MSKNFLLATSAICALVSTTPVMAQSEGSGIETITVTAEKRSENIQTVPLSIVALSGEQLQDESINNITELQKTVPNVQFQNVSQYSGATIRIRGFGSNPNTAIDADVVTNLDGIFVPRPGAAVTTFLDVQDVEVLRGPQGTLQGRNAVMGALSIATNAPSTDQRSLDVWVSGGSYDTFNGQAVGNMPLSDTFAVRLALGMSHTDGDVHNLLDGKTYGEMDSPEGRLSAKWDIAPNVTWIVRLDGAVTHGDGVQAYVVDVGTSPGGNAPFPNSAISIFNHVIGLFGGTPLYTGPISHTENMHVDGELQDSQIGLSSTLNWEVTPDITLRLTDSYREWTDDQLDGDALWSSLPVMAREANFASNSNSHELQLITPKGAFLNHTLGFTAGLYYEHEGYSQDLFYDVQADLCDFTGAGKANCETYPTTNASYSLFKQSDDNWAGYFQLNYQIMPDLELDLGARQTTDNKSGSFLSNNLNPWFGLLGVAQNEYDPTLKFQDSKPSWLASLSWQATDKVMAFATFATGYKSGGFNDAQAASLPLPRVFASEFATDYEVGVKSLWWDDRLLLNADLFNTTLNNFQDRSFNGTAFIIRNSGNVRSRGLEFEGKLLATDNISLTSNFGYLDSIYQSDSAAPNFDGCSAAHPSTPGTQCATVTQNLSGRQLPFAPKWSGDAGVEFDSDPFWNGFKANFAVDEQFMSKYLSSNTDNPQTLIAGYGLTNARLTLLSNSNWKIDLYGTNLLDRQYITSVFAQSLGSGLGINNKTTGTTIFRGYLGDSRMLGIRLSASF